MGRYTDPNSGIFWLVLIAAVVVIALLFPAVRVWLRPVRVWLWGTWLKFRGLRLGHRATRYTDMRRIGAELDDNFHDIKYHYLKEVVRDIQRWTSGPQKRLLKRLGTLRVYEKKFTDQQEELETRLGEEQKYPRRDRPRIKGLLYYIVATLLAIADIAITFMCLQALNYPIIFLLPSAVMLGLIGFLAGDFLGKNIEPAQKNPNKEKNRMAIVLLAVFSALYCLVFGTMRFLYTQYDPSVSPLLNFVGSYGFIAIIVGCSVMLGWLHEGITTQEQLDYVKTRRARVEVSIDRCDKNGAKLTHAFHAHIGALGHESATVRSQFRSGFNIAWKGRAPYGVEEAGSPLGLDEDIIKSLTWPNPPNQTVTLKPRATAFEDLSRYDEGDEGVRQPAQPHPAPPRPAPPVPPPPVSLRAWPNPAPPRPAPPGPPPVSALQDGPPPIG